MIVKDNKGNEMLGMITVAEDEADSKYSPIACSLIVVKTGGEYLLGWNRWRQDWEIFGGCREAGETMRECATREGCEELGLENAEYTFIGLMHTKMAPGYFNPEWHEEYAAIYGITLPASALEDIEANRRDKEEIEKLAFYSSVKGREPVAAIDEKLLEYWEWEDEI